MNFSAKIDREFNSCTNINTILEQIQYLQSNLHENKPEEENEVEEENNTNENSKEQNDG